MPAARTKPEPARQQLERMIREFTPRVAADARATLRKARRLFPGAIEMVYDNFRWLVIGFSPTERPSEAIVSVVVTPTHVTLCFLQEASKLPDPGKRLRGTGRMVRNVRLAGPETLDEPEVLALIEAAKECAVVELRPRQKRQIVIRAIAKRKWPRRPE